MQAIGHQINVVNRFVFGTIRHIAHFQATQPFHPAHALNTRDDQAKWKAILWAQHLAIHAPSHNGILERAIQVDGAGHAGAITTFGQYEFAFFEIGPAFIEQDRKRYAREFAARQHAVGVLHGWHRYIAPLQTSIGATLNKMNARYRWHAH